MNFLYHTLQEPNTLMLSPSILFLLSAFLATACLASPHVKTLTYTNPPTTNSTFTLSHPTSGNIFYLCNFKHPEMRAAIPINGSAIHYNAAGMDYDGVYTLYPTTQTDTANVRFMKVERTELSLLQRIKLCYEKIRDWCVSIVRKIQKTPEPVEFGVEPEEILRWAMKQFGLKDAQNYSTIATSKGHQARVAEIKRAAMLQASAHLGAVLEYSFANEQIRLASSLDIKKRLETAKKILTMPILQYIATYRRGRFDYLFQLQTFISNSEQAWARLENDYFAASLRGEPMQSRLNIATTHSRRTL